MRLLLERAHHGRRMGGGGRGLLPKGPSFQVSLFQEWGTLHPHHCTHRPQTCGSLAAARNRRARDMRAWDLVGA